MRKIPFAGIEGSNSRPNVSEGYEAPTELPGSTGTVHKIEIITTVVVYSSINIYADYCSSTKQH